MWRARIARGLGALALAAACAGAAASQNVAVEEVMRLPQGPGNLTILPDGRRVVSLHQFWNPARILAEVRGADRLVEFPGRGEGTLTHGMGAVLGVRADTAGMLWILDNGNAAKTPPKMLVWDPKAGRLVRTIPLGSAADTNSLLQDWAFDRARQQLYIADPAGGTNAALVVVDLRTGAARRVLQGDRSVVNEDSSLVVEGKQIMRKRPDGTLERPKLGVDGILMDRAGNLYLGDVEHNAIGVITASDRTYRELARSPDYKWVDDFEFGTDGMLYVVMTQLHLSPEFDAGRREPQLPFRVFRLRPLAPGRQGY